MYCRLFVLHVHTYMYCTRCMCVLPRCVVVSCTFKCMYTCACVQYARTYMLTLTYVEMCVTGGHTAMFAHPLQRQDHTEVTGPHLTLVLPVSVDGHVGLNVQWDLLISRVEPLKWCHSIGHQLIGL